MATEKASDCLPGDPICFEGFEPRPDQLWSDDPLHNQIARDLAQAAPSPLFALTADDFNAASDAELVGERLIGDVPRLELAAQWAQYSGVIEGPEVKVDDADHAWVLSRVVVFRVGIGGPAGRLRLWPWKAASKPRTNEEMREADGRSRSGQDGLPLAMFTVHEGWVYTYTQTLETEADDVVEASRARTLEQRLLDLQGYVDAHNEALTASVARLAAGYEEAVARRRREVEMDSKAAIGLRLIPEPLPTPALDPVSTEASEESTQFPLPGPYLMTASFDSIVDTINRFGKEISNGAGNLSTLGEDGLTTVLCAALTLTFGMANHGVFVHNGSTDITVPAGRLAEIQGIDLPEGSPDVFVAETKKGGGGALARDALEQLHHYLTRDQTHGALVFYLSHDDPAGARGRILAALRSHDDHVASGDYSTDGGVDVLAVRDDRFRVDRLVAVVFISLPKLGTQPQEADAHAADRVQGG